jgi:hypothetical protein
MGSATSRQPNVKSNKEWSVGKEFHTSRTRTQGSGTRTQPSGTRTLLRVARETRPSSGSTSTGETPKYEYDQHEQEEFRSVSKSRSFKIAQAYSWRPRDFAHLHHAAARALMPALETGRGVVPSLARPIGGSVALAPAFAQYPRAGWQGRVVAAEGC